MKHNTRAAPPYSEAQATAWLAWLARGMQRHGQTIFLIEQLQPSWLTTRVQRRVYLLTTRLLWGIIIGLVVGLIYTLNSFLSERLFAELYLRRFFTQSELSLWLNSVQGLGQLSIRELTQWLSHWLIWGLIVGLTGGLIDVVRTDRERLQFGSNAALRRWQIILGVLLFLLIGSLLTSLVFTFSYLLSVVLGWSRLLSFGELVGKLVFDEFGVLSSALSSNPFGVLIAGLFWAQRSLGRHFRKEIHTTESIRLSLAHFFRGFSNGLILGLIVFLCNLFIFGPRAGSNARLGALLMEVIRRVHGTLSQSSLAAVAEITSAILTYNLFEGLVGGLILGSVLGLLSSFRPFVRELHTIPNQGIRLSARNGSLMGGVVGLALGLIVGLLWGGPVNGLINGVLGGLCIGLWYGGLDVIQHYIVRALLVRQGVMPRNYARFLDYAAEELNFLQKVGGGYMFVHRYLLEYFAAIEQPKPVAPADGEMSLNRPTIRSDSSRGGLR